MTSGKKPSGTFMNDMRLFDVNKNEWRALNFNKKFTDDDAVALADLGDSGALAKLERLYLSDNQIGDYGMKAFSTAIASGALPKLEVVNVSSNPGNKMGMKEACRARGIAAV